MNVEKKLQDEIIEYCKLNDIQDVDSFLNKIIKIGFNIEKWGDLNEKVNNSRPIELDIPKIVEEPKIFQQKAAPVIQPETQPTPQPKQTEPKPQFVILTKREVEPESSDDIYNED